MTKKQKIEQLTDYSFNLFPNAKCALNYSQDYELAIAVMLSAQTNDIAVNKATSVLFSKYKTLEEFEKADVEDIENIIHNLGLYKNKAQNIKGIAAKIIHEYNGKLPSDKEQLMVLPGIGNKSAGVIRIEVFNIPDFPVDTHILRIGKRLKIIKENDMPIVMEQTVKKNLSPEFWKKAHHSLIFFGRYHCKAINPQCQNCKIKELCSKN